MGGSNTDANRAVTVTADLKTVYDGEFACNGGAFFWVALHDINGAWSDAVGAEVRKTAGCSHTGGGNDDGGDGGTDIDGTIECECRDGSTHAHAGCVCENESCPSTVGRI